MVDTAQIGNTVANYCEGRENNFNLLRILAASLVVFSHAFGLTGHGDIEPLVVTFGISLGSWAVNIFFVSSGFLIAKSWDRNRSWKRFLWARFVRIYPALWVNVFFCVFVVGLIFTSYSWREYFFHMDTFKFIAENTTLLIKGVFPTLPGTFVGIASGSVNFPLWTLPYELRMYLLLLALGATGWLYRGGVVKTILMASLFIHVVTYVVGPKDGVAAEYARFIFFYFCGSYFYLERARIVLRGYISAAMVGGLALSILLIDVPLRTLVLSLATPYLALYFALVPGGLLREYRRVGDYSYGLYIYGAPVQMSLLALAGGSMAVTANFAFSWLLAGVLAVLSWHLVERKALKFTYDKLILCLQFAQPRPVQPPRPRQE